MVDGFQQFFRRRQAAFPGCSAGQKAGIGLYEFPPVRFQLLQIPLGGRVFIHMGIHGRSHKLGTGAGQGSGREHVVSEPVCELRDDVGRGRGDDEDVRLFRQGDVFNLIGVLAVEGVRYGPVLRQGVEGQWGHEPGGILRHDDIDISSLLHEGRSQFTGLVGRNSARDAEQNIFFFQHGNFLQKMFSGIIA